jgi:hypothetical protein
LSFTARFTLTGVDETIELRSALAFKVLAESLRTSRTLEIGNNLIQVLDATTTNESIAINLAGHVGPHLGTVSLEIVVKAHGTSVGNGTWISANLTVLTSILTAHIVRGVAMTMWETSRGRTEYIRGDTAKCSILATSVGLSVAGAFLGADVTNESVFTLVIGGTGSRVHGELERFVIWCHGGVVAWHLGFIVAHLTGHGRHGVFVCRRRLRGGGRSRFSFTFVDNFARTCTIITGAAGLGSLIALHVIGPKGRGVIAI